MFVSPCERVGMLGLIGVKVAWVDWSENTILGMVWSGV